MAKLNSLNLLSFLDPVSDPVMVLSDERADIKCMTTVTAAVIQRIW